jgi:hypothetical protein
MTTGWRKLFLKNIEKIGKNKNPFGWHMGCNVMGHASLDFVPSERTTP